ncbi:MAG: precorrin-6y C5,15-methyltransferase (decarboxylating) subunit CbiE [Prevotella sp.]|nr:precorrin-6y C5,15-methyltransferase (decarboxylating) subunit CbiE [Prevotella sp.]
MRFIVIGITDNPNPWFPPEVMEMIKQGRVFSGGKRHHGIVAPLLPEDAEWIDITAPLDNVFEQYQIVNCKSIIVFASGDPLFFGFANTIKRKMPEAEIVLYPSFNSLQMLAHRLVMPYHDMRIVSLTGRPWPEFDKALIERVEKIGVLTDKEHTPTAIAQRMLEYGYNYYKMYVGEHLGHPTLEKVTTLSLEEAAKRTFDNPNCILLNVDCRTENVEFVTAIGLAAANSTLYALNSKLYFGIPDSEFSLLDGREKMITKMPIRLLTLQALELPKRKVLWDIGFCTGSVSIEARLQFPHLHIEAFEIRSECEVIIHENARRFGAPGINIHIGDFLETDITALPHPEAVFIGGHGGQLKEIIAKVLTVLNDDGIIVMNSVKAPKVSTDSHRLWDEACAELGLRQEPPTKIILNENHPIEILKCSR